MRLRRVTLEATNALPPSSPTTRAINCRLTTPERPKLPPVVNELAPTPARDLPHLAQAKQAMKRTPEADLARAATDFLALEGWRCAQNRSRLPLQIGQGLRRARYRRLPAPMDDKTPRLL